MAQGFKKVIFSSGGADFGAEIFVQRRTGFMDAVGDSMEVVDVSGFPGDQFFADQPAAKNIQAFGLAIPMICNAVDGNADALKEGGLATDIAAPGWIVTNAEDCEKILTEQTNRNIITVDDMLSLCKNVNSDASAETLKGIV